jgi:hypothetical protein
MTHRNTWKQRERDIAHFFGGERTPLSGGNSKHTCGDVIHDKLYVEVKYRAKHTLYTLWDDTKKKADKEGKTPVVCICEKGRPGFLIVAHCDDFTKI